MLEFIGILPKIKDFAYLCKDGTDRGRNWLLYDPNGMLVVDAFLEEFMFKKR